MLSQPPGLSRGRSIYSTPDIPRSPPFRFPNLASTLPKTRVLFRVSRPAHWVKPSLGVHLLPSCPQYSRLVTSLHNPNMLSSYLKCETFDIARQVCAGGRVMDTSLDIVWHV
jgi:hypothetical protein